MYSWKVNHAKFVTLTLKCKEDAKDVMNQQDCSVMTVE